MIPYIFLKKNLNKLRRVHKIFFILIFACSISARSQQKEHELNHVLPLPVGSMRIDSFSHWLARESGFVFSFNAEKINPGKEIKFPGKKESLNELLFYLHAHYGINHRLIGNHIILCVDNPVHKKTVVSISKKEKYPSEKASEVKKKGKQTKALPEEKFRPTAPTILPDAGHEISYMPNSFMLSPKIIKVINKPANIPQTKIIEDDSNTQEKSLSQQDQQNADEKQNRKDNTLFNNGNNNLYIAAGFTGSEVLYVNPQIRAGLPWLFASVGWRTNFKASGFFYGIGTSIRLSKNWGIQLSASNGVLSKIYQKSNSDTLIRIKSRLSQINLSVEKHFGNRWMLEFGPVLNFMNSNYTSTVATANSPLLAGTNKNYYIIRPPYTFSSSYNEKTGIEKKLWIGLQVGLFYRLR